MSYVVVRHVGLIGLALAMSTAVARAEEDGPPADLLSHVKVGQRWTLRSINGEQAVEEVQHVAEVHPGRVVFTLTTRVLQGGKLLVEDVGDEPQEWTWGGRTVTDTVALGLMKASQSRRTLEVAGLRLECMVTTTSEPPSESWMATRGDLETYPGHVKGVMDGRPLRALVSVEDGPPPALRSADAPSGAEEQGLPPGALDHVKVGQRWVFGALPDQGTSIELVWTIVEVAPAEGRVRYRVKTTTRLEGDAEIYTEEEEEPQEWLAGGTPVVSEGLTVAGMTTGRKRLQVPGAALDCYVTIFAEEGSEPLEMWTAVRGDREVFPGAVKQLVGTTVGLRLERVEGP